MEKIKRIPCSVIAGIIFALSAILSLLALLSSFIAIAAELDDISDIAAELWFWGLLGCVGLAVMAVSLLMNKRKLFVAGIAFCCIPCIRSLINVNYISEESYVILYYIESLIEISVWIILIIMVFKEKLSEKIIKKLFISLIVLLVIHLISEFVLSFYCFGIRFISSSVGEIFTLAAKIFSAAWLMGYGKIQQKESGEYNNEQIINEAYCPMSKHVLLLIFTCGIWLLIWIYRTTDRLNCAKNEPPRNPTSTLLLCMFVPFYYIYWTYKSAQRIDGITKEKGIPSDMSTLCLILAIFVGIVPPIIMQDKINAIVSAPQKAINAAQEQTAPAAQINSGTGSSADELKKYKELLDMGAITQEEFDEKKKQLLGL